MWIIKKLKLEGQTFGKWKVLKENGTNSCGQTFWLCECSCEKHTQKNVIGSTLVNGNSTSCGCNTNNKKYNTYNLSDEYGIGYTLKGEEFYFDLEDYDKIKKYCWRINDSGYVVTTEKRKTIRLHRLILNVNDTKMQVDHIYHNKIDNRKDKLRIVTNMENSWNKYSKGVYYDRTKKKWAARLKCNGKKALFKRFDKIEDALEARQKAEDEFFKEYKYKENSQNSRSLDI